MEVINQTKGTILSSKAKKALSWTDKIFGLLLKNNPRCLIFDTHFGLHTFGMTAPIDILVINNQGIVVKVGRSVAPNQFYFYNPIYSRVIELPANTITSSKTAINDKIIVNDTQF